MAKLDFNKLIDLAMMGGIGYGVYWVIKEFRKPSAVLSSVSDATTKIINDVTKKASGFPTTYEELLRSVNKDDSLYSFKALGKGVFSEVRSTPTEAIAFQTKLPNILDILASLSPLGAFPSGYKLISDAVGNIKYARVNRTPEQLNELPEELSPNYFQNKLKKISSKSSSSRVLKKEGRTTYFYNPLKKGSNKITARVRTAR